MMAFQHTACFFLGAVFLLSFADAAPAPAEEGVAQSQALDLLNTEPGSSRCYYNFQHYEEGDRIITNEPCLNCTCHKRMLMCYLRVCPFTKPVGQDCTVEKKPDQCCPVITCPEVHVDIVTSSTTEASSSSSSAVGHIGKYGCTLEDNTFYPDGVQMPSDPKKPCELCYCIRNHTACVRQECTLNVEGCRPVYQEGVCCPVRYDCDYNEISTTEKPSTGGLLLGTTASTAQQCRFGDTLYNDGELIETDKPCESCYCMRGDIVCAVRSCGEPMEGKDCHALPPPEGQCCPTTFQCANGTISIENMATESGIIMHPSSMDTDISTKGPDSQATSEETSDDNAEDEKIKDEEVTSKEKLTSNSSKEDENKGDTHDEKNDDHQPGGLILSEPIDADDLDEDALDFHPDQKENQPEKESPKVSDQPSTSVPDTADKVVPESQSNLISEVNMSESTISNTEGVAAQNEKEAGESIMDKIKPDSENLDGDSENSTGKNELTPEKHETVTEIPINPVETSESKLDDDIKYDVTDSVLTEAVTQSTDVTKETTLVPGPSEIEDKKNVPTTTKVEEEMQSVVSTGEENVPSNDDAENSLPETLQNSGAENDKTEIETTKITPSDEKSSEDQKPEKINESPMPSENEIKFEEVPSKTPESLDQVKESETTQEKVNVHSNNYPATHISEESMVPPAHHDNQEITDQEKEMELVPEQSGTESTDLSEEHIEHIHKEQAPPRKEDASAVESEQLPQHPEGSMTKAEDSILDGQVQTEGSLTTLPSLADVAEKQHGGSGGIYVTSPVGTDSSVTHDGSQENEENSVTQKGELDEGSDASTDKQNIHNSSPGQNLEEKKTEQTSDVPGPIESTEPATESSGHDIESENSETTTIDKILPDTPVKEETNVSSDSGSVPTVIVMEQESETSTDSLPEESSHGEVKPETTLLQDSNNDFTNDVEGEDQSLETKKPAETELDKTPEKPGDENKPTGDKNSEHDNVSSESTQSPSNADDTKEENEESSPELKPSSDGSDLNTSLDNLNKEVGSVTDNAFSSETTDKPEEDGLASKDKPVSEGGPMSATENFSSEKGESVQSHKDSTDSLELPNEVKPTEGEQQESGVQTEETTGIEQSTDSLIKTETESKPDDTESEKKGDKPAVEDNPAEPSKNPTPEIGLPDGEVHHDPVESEPTEFDDPGFEDTSDQDPTSENEIVEDHLLGHGGALPHESPSLTPGPVGVIPGEGDCLVDGNTYTNNSNIPSKSPCHKECTCISSIVHCQGIDCPPPPPELANCMPIHQGDLCCPVYTCDGNIPEGPQSHNQLGENGERDQVTEDHTSSTTDTKHSEATEQATIPTGVSEEIPNSQLGNESEAHKEDSEQTEHQSGEPTGSVEGVVSGSGEDKPENPETSVSDDNKEMPSPDTVFQEHDSELGSNKLPADNETEKEDTLEENSETKPDTETDSAEKVSAEQEKNTQATVLTDQSEINPTITEASVVEESPSKPNEEHTVSAEDEFTQQSSENPETEISQTGETQEVEGHQEPGVELDSTMETQTQTLLESVDENIQKVTEKDNQVVSEIPKIQPGKESDSLSTESSVKQSETSVQDTENNVQDIVTEIITGAQEEVVNQDSVETQEPVVTETVVTGKPNLEETSQEDELNETHKDVLQPESEDQSGSIVNSEQQTGISSSEASLGEETGTEVVPKSPESPKEENIPSSVVEGSLLDTNDNTVPLKTDDEGNTTEQTLEEDKKTEDANNKISTSPSDANPENGSSNESEQSVTLSSTEVEEAETNRIPAPEANHDETESGDTEDQNEEITEGFVESHLELSTEAPSFNGPSTQKPLLAAEHVEDTHLETTKSPVGAEEHVASTNDSSSEEVTNSVIDEHVTSSETHEATHDQSAETTSVSQETNYNISDKHEPETTESSQHSELDTSEATNEIKEHISESTGQEASHPENETAQQIDVPGQETSEPSKIGDVQGEGVIHDEEGDVHAEEEIQNSSNEEHIQSTEIPKEENIKEEGGHDYGENGQVHEETESSKNEEEMTTETYIETAQAETKPAQAAVESAHEESKPALPGTELSNTEEESSTENLEPAIEESKPANEESKPAHEEPEPIHPESEPANEETQPTHKDSEQDQEESEQANEDSEPAHEDPESAHETDQTHEKPEPVNEENEPAHEETEPTQEESEPAHEETDPAHEEIEAAQVETEKPNEDTEPAHVETEPTHEVTEPTHVETEPIHLDPEQPNEETEPDHVDPEQPNEGTETAHVDPEQPHEETETAHVDPEQPHEETETAHVDPEQPHEETETAHVDPEQPHEETEPTHVETEQPHEETETAHVDPEHPNEETETAHVEPEQPHEETEAAHVDPEQPHEETEAAHEETEAAHEETEAAHVDPEPTHGEPELVTEETESSHEETENENEVPVNEVDNAQESVTSVNNAEQSTAGSDSMNEMENVHHEPENEDENQPHPTIQSEHAVEPEPTGSETEHTQETEQTPDENIIGEGEHLTHVSEQAMHETDISHTQGPGSLPSITGTTHIPDDSKPQHSKPDDPELPPEDQFTPDVDMDYDVSEDGAFGPGTCRYGGKVYVSAQQIPRDDPCDFCFCFRSDIICLQQSCPPPIHRCHQEPIQGYCCPRYQCPVSMATSLNITTTTSTTTTTLPPHFFAHAYHGAARQSGCFHRGRAYEVGEEIASASGPCLQCICGSDGQMRCDPKVCNPEPMVRKLMEAAVSHRRR